ncbi:hypothetical protein TNCV_3853441 [Trichonephila clavipes]|nr:hypothetical protein TNCV_3853441 [Trichonephila clavipes]
MPDLSLPHKEVLLCCTCSIHSLILLLYKQLSPYYTHMQRIISPNSTHSANKNELPPSLLGADQQWSCPVEQSATPQRLRGKTSDSLYRSVTK